MLDFNLSVTLGEDVSQVYGLIIFSGGPAGLTAGLYAARYKLNTLMLEKAPVSSGQMTTTQWIENYPGFPEPVLGQKLTQDMEAQAQLFGLKIVNEDVRTVDLSGPIKAVTTDYNSRRSHTILISTGSSPRKLGIPGEVEYTSRGVSYCATCDGPFYPDKVIAVAGGDNSAFKESLFLAKYARLIHIINRSDRFRSDPILHEKVKEYDKIQLITETVIVSLDFANEANRKIRIKNLKSGEQRDMEVDGLFVFVGNIPNTALFEGKLEMENGYIVTDPQHQTSQSDVWVAGDVQAKSLRQVATAVGDGVDAAYRIHKYLDEKDLVV